MSREAKYPSPQRKAVAYVAPVLACAALMIAGVSVTMVGSSHSGLPGLKTSPVPYNEEPSLASVLASLRLTPEAFAAAGVGPAELAGSLAAVREYLSEHGTGLGAARADLQASRASVERLERLVQSGAASQADIQSLANARSSLQSAASTYEHLLSEAFSAACGPFTPTKAEYLSNIRANANSGLPMKYRTILRAEADAHALREALASVRIASRLGRDADQSCASLVATADALAATVAAQGGTSENLAGNAAAWRAALAQ